MQQVNANINKVELCDVSVVHGGILVFSVLMSMFIDRGNSYKHNKSSQRSGLRAKGEQSALAFNKLDDMSFLFFF